MIDNKNFTTKFETSKSPLTQLSKLSKRSSSSHLGNRCKTKVRVQPVEQETKRILLVRSASSMCRIITMACKINWTSCTRNDFDSESGVVTLRLEDIRLA